MSRSRKMFSYQSMSRSRKMFSYLSSEHVPEQEDGELPEQ